MKRLLIICLAMIWSVGLFAQKPPTEFTIVKTHIEQFQNLYTYHYNTLVEVYIQTPEGTSKREIRKLKRYIKLRAQEIAMEKNKKYKYIVKINVF